MRPMSGIANAVRLDSFFAKLACISCKDRKAVSNQFAIDLLCQSMGRICATSRCPALSGRFPLSSGASGAGHWGRCRTVISLKPVARDIELC